MTAVLKAGDIEDSLGVSPPLPFSLSLSLSPFLFLSPSPLFSSPSLSPQSLSSPLPPSVATGNCDILLATAMFSSRSTCLFAISTPKRARPRHLGKASETGHVRPEKSQANSGCSSPGRAGPGRDGTGRARPVDRARPAGRALEGEYDLAAGVLAADQVLRRRDLPPPPPPPPPYRQSD